MSRELLDLVTALANEKNVGEDVVFEALEYALAGATKKTLLNSPLEEGAKRPEDIDVQVNIDRATGDYKTFRRWAVVQDEDYTYPDLEKTIEQIQEEDPDSELQVGDYQLEPMPGVAFNRIGAQTAKQYIMQRIRDAEKKMHVEEFLATGETLIKGTVKRIDNRKQVVVEVGRMEAVIPWRETLPTDSFAVGSPITALFDKIETVGTRTVVRLTRRANEFLKKVIELEIPEVEEGKVKVMAIARDPGFRSKVAVAAGDARIDPQGTLIGQRGTRIRQVMRHLGGERIDVVLWSPDISQFIVNALSPATITGIYLDEEERKVEVEVDAEELPKAIGRNGQNVNLAKQLTGWDINILTNEDVSRRHQEEFDMLRETFARELNVDDEIASTLVREGFVSLEEIAFCDESEFLSIPEFDDDVIAELRVKAREKVLQTRVLELELLKTVSGDLKELWGADDPSLLKLAEQGVLTVDDLADLAADELVEITGCDAQRARDAIMEARSHWADEGEGGENV